MCAGLLSHAWRGRGALALAALAFAGAILLGPSPGSAAPSSGIVVNEVYGGGGNSGATYTNDFIELRNRGTAAVSLDGWSVQYHSGGATGSWQVTPLSGSIAPGAIHLVAEAAGTGGTQPLPTPQTSGTIPISGTAGTVALVNATAALTCSDSAACQAASVDLVGYGTAVINEGAPAARASNTDSVQRKDAADSDNNAGDFASGAPTPGATNVGGDGGGTGDGDPGPLRIHDIQDSSWVAAHNGDQVSNVPGIVTAIRTTGSSRGYWIQDPDPDASAATSEGIFIFASSPGVAVGDEPQAAGQRVRLPRP